MRLTFYLKMAISNIKSNKRLYLPFILSSSGIIALYYIVASLTNNESFYDSFAGNTIVSFLSMGQDVILLFAVIFLFYINSFMIKKRKTELGLYNVLGLEKRHIVLIVLFETLAVLCLALSLGIIFGIIFEKALFLIILQMIGQKAILGFMFSVESLISTIVISVGIFGLLFIYSSYEVLKASPIELLKAKNVGEKEPKAKWLLAILGFASLFGGYYVARMSDVAVENLVYFFPAVILVIIGTYLLFICGSIAILKLLKKNKRIYYKTNHFITISNMIYRMKKNAVGLASICILSTMILVMISSTSSLYFSIDDTVKNGYPCDYTYATYDEESILSHKEIFESIAKKQGASITYYDRVDTLASSAYIGEKEIIYTNEYDNHDILEKILNTIYITQDDYNEMSDNKVDLSKNELVVINKGIVEKGKLKIGDHYYEVKDVRDNDMTNFPGSNQITSNELIVVVKDKEVLNDIDKVQKDVYGEYASDIRYHSLYNLENDDPEAIMEAYYNTNIDLDVSAGLNGSFNSQKLVFDEFKGFYSGFLFLGIFLGLTFMIAIVLIIYYKQISEGDEDRERYVIMTKVGLTDQEIRKTVNYQILLVFFAPLVVSIIHLCVAYKPISLILFALSQNESVMFSYTFMISVIAFAILYTIVFILTSKTYYRIVSKR